MVSTRGRAASATPHDPPQSDQTLHRDYPFLELAGDKRARSPQSDLTHTPKTPTPSIPGVAIPAAVNKSNRSEPTHNRKARTFSIPGVATSGSAAAASFPIPKSVHLHDWWLNKAQGKNLSVGGFAARGRQGVRVFCSASIAKRFNTTTLETIDGITVTISGLINRCRTHQNGFPLEVCDHFLLGFPYYWDEYAAKCYNEESSSRDSPPSNPYAVEHKMSSGSCSKDFQSVSLYDLPVTRCRDLIMSVMGDSESGVMKRSILDGIFGEFSGNGSKHTVDPVVEEQQPPPTKQKSPRVKKKYKERVKTRDTWNKTEIMESNVLSPGTGVATRSMTRLSSLKTRCR